VPEPRADDIGELAGFGYRQVLDRTLGGFSSFAAGFSYISILTGVFQMFHVGYGAGGPAFFWTWPLVFLGQMTVALCFAELAARYPLSGGVYQWSQRISSRGVGWMAGWVYLGGSVISLAAVALALQATLPQIAPVFQLIGDRAVPADSARNAALLGGALVGLSTLINAVGVRLLARVNNAGVIIELTAAALLIGLLAASAGQRPGLLFETLGHGQGEPLGYLGPFLAASLMASYVLYGFDTAGALAEETEQPRQKAPWAIIQALTAAATVGGLLILVGILAAKDPAQPELASIAGGLPLIVKDVLGPMLGTALLVAVVFAIFMCAVAVQAAAVRLIFAMARDNNLPCASALARVQARTKAPIVPAVVIGAAAVAILIVNVNLPRAIETLCTVAIVWANLAYLFVTVPLLVRRLKRPSVPPANRTAEAGSDDSDSACFSLGRWGTLVNLIAVVWGLFLVVNVGWPRPEIHGTSLLGRLAAPIATLALVGSGWVYYFWFQRKRVGILVEHRADKPSESGAYASPATALDTGWIGQLARGVPD
jgi:urea carboxylase system permease